MSTVNTTQNSYSQTFANTENVDESLKFVSHRVTHGAITNDHIADFIKKYAEIQVEFGKKIDHLIKKSHPSSSDLGTFEESWNLFLKMVATEGLSAYNVGTDILKTVEPAVRNSKDRKETHNILNGLHADSKTLSKVSYKGKVLNGMDKLQEIEEARLQALRESIGHVGNYARQSASEVGTAAENLNDALASFTPQQDVESYLGQVVAGDIRFPDLSPAASAGYTETTINRYASPNLEAQDGGHSVRPQASPFELSQDRKESRIKKFFGKGN